VSREIDERTRIERRIRAKAQKRVRAKVGFYWHFMVFALVNAAAIAINLTQTPKYLWFIWLLAAWSIGLAFHAFATFSSGEMTSAMLEDEIARELERRGIA
jgi:hypothetical protein